MDLVAHRGFDGVHPENTLAAVTAAAEQADAVEVDVRRSRDGRPVVIHDETVDRVTDATGDVTDYTAEELASLEVLDSGQGVPTLATVCDALPADVGLVIELKDDGLAEDIVAVVDATGVDHVAVSSFDPAVLREMSAACDWPLALLTEEDPNGAIETALELGCEAVHPDCSLVDESFVERAHAAGLEVTVWTVDSAATASRARRAGVDGVIVDSPAVC